MSWCSLCIAGRIERDILWECSNDGTSFSRREQHAGFVDPSGAYLRCVRSIDPISNISTLISGKVFPLCLCLVNKRERFIEIHRHNGITTRSSLPRQQSRRDTL